MTVTINTEEKTIRPKEAATLEELAKLEGILRAHYGDGDWRIVGRGAQWAWAEPEIEGQPVPMPTVPMPPYPIQMPTTPGFGSPFTGDFTVPYYPSTSVLGSDVTVAAAWDGPNIVATNAA